MALPRQPSPQLIGNQAAITIIAPAPCPPPPVSLLIIEDERKAAIALHTAFLDHHIAATVCDDGEAGLDLVSRNRFDLVVLDLGLPGRSGLEILRDLRGQGVRVPVLILTARDAIDDRVAGLEAGADDYVVKPYAFPEVLARVRALLRRGTAEETRLQIGDLELDLLRRTAVRAGHPIDLTTIEFNLLRLLMSSPGEPIPRRMLAEKIWDIHFDSDTNVVEVGIRRLRMKIDGPFGIKLIQTIKGLGYACIPR